MSAVSAVLRPALRGWRVYALGGVAVLLVFGLLTARFHIAGIGGGSGSGSNGSALAGAGNGSNGHSNNGNGSKGSGANGALANGATPSASATASSGSGSGSGNPKSSPTPKQTIPAAADSINGSADYLQSDCGSGYEPGAKCTVYYHGLYDLVSQPTGKVVLEVIIDGVVSGTTTYVAPAGPHRFGGNIVFTVPEHAKKIVYQSLLEDATGKVIQSSKQQVTAGYG